jgi:exodeoxyribonuclease VII small subunit
MAKKDSFEASLSALEKVVEKLDSGGVSLEESLKLFQEGKQHSKICSQKLSQVEKRIQLLLENENGDLAVEDFAVGEVGAPEDETD